MNAAPQSRDSLKLELAAEILREFSEVRFIAQGTSMLPAIYPGDCLTVRSFGTKAPRCGDIVLCRRANEFRVHRIASVLEKGSAKSYVLCGDALTEADPPVSAGELLGRVTSIASLGESFKPNSPHKAHFPFLRSIVRCSKVATVLLLRWHAMQAHVFLRAESFSACSAEAKTEPT